METDFMNTEYKVQPPETSGRWKLALKILLPVLIIVVGAAGAYQISRSGPEAQRKKPEKPLSMVQVMSLRAASERIVVPAMGSVIPARELQLRSRVSGHVVAVHPEFTEGGIVKAGEEMIRLDPEDYRLAMEKQQAQVVNARYALKLEMGQQAVAKREWQVVNAGKPMDDLADSMDKELALRKPHLEKAQADLSSAEADLKQAQLNLERTRVVAPFNAVILSKNVEKGSQVSTQDELAQLVGTDEFRVQVSIPVDELKWITVPRKAGEPGAAARIFYGNNSGAVRERTGQVIRLLGDLETEGRMARLLVAVKDPMDLNTSANVKMPLLIGQYVRVEIDGRRIEPAFSIPRSALREDSSVWIAANDETLHIRSVNVIWRDEATVLVTDGLNDGEQLIVSDLSSPVEGMKIRVAGKLMADSEPITDNKSQITNNK